jgi:hypothetical protein
MAAVVAQHEIVISGESVLFLLYPVNEYSSVFLVDAMPFIIFYNWLV